MEPGDGGDRHAGLHGLLDQPNLFLGSVASAAFAAGDDFDALDGLRHRRMPRLPPRPSRLRRLSGRIGGRSSQVVQNHSFDHHFVIKNHTMCHRSARNRNLSTQRTSLKVFLSPGT
jgi:hypothetical protein